MTNPNRKHADSTTRTLDLESISRTLTRVGHCLGIVVDPTLVHAMDFAAGEVGDLEWLRAAALHSNIELREVDLKDVGDAIGLIRNGSPIVLRFADGELAVLEKNRGRRFHSSGRGDRIPDGTVSHRRVAKLLRGVDAPTALIATRQLSCDAISASSSDSLEQGDDHHARHLTPLQRFIGLLYLDRNDTGIVVLFAFVAGVLSLATPLAIEALVNVVSWGTQFQPLIVLGLMLLTCLSLGGMLRILQTVVVEIIQRRQFVRIVSDLSHRFPRAHQASMRGKYPREFANRVFDIMTIQKATAVLLLDGISIVLTTVLGMAVLAFYHPFLLGFVVALLISMVAITWLLGRGGIGTSIDESVAKYHVAHWLQDVISQPSIFKFSGGVTLAINRADRLTAEYILARRQQFRVVIRQVAFAILLQVVASTAVLVLGGYLVIEGTLTLGQLVASELIVTVVVGSFAKAGKAIEKFYDLMAGIDKVGHLLDLPTDPPIDLGHLPEGPADVAWENLKFATATAKSEVAATQITAGSRVAVVGNDVSGRSWLAEAIAGVGAPTEGMVQIAGMAAIDAANNGEGRIVAYAGRRDVFCGTLRENVSCGRRGIGHRQVREALRSVGLSPSVVAIDQWLQTDGYPFSRDQVSRLILARAVVAAPKLLVVDVLLDELNDSSRTEIWNTLTSNAAPWTLVVVTHREDLAMLCDRQIEVSNCR